MGRNKKTYTDEFKLKCIKELLDGKAFSEVCSSNNVASCTLSSLEEGCSSVFVISPLISLKRTAR